MPSPTGARWSSRARTGTATARSTPASWSPSVHPSTRRKGWGRTSREAEGSIMSELGRLSLLLGFACSIFAVGSIAWGLRTGLSGPLRGGRRAVWTVCGLTVLAVIILERALLARDMSYRYVAEHTSKDLPLHYAFTSLWAGQEGSLLLWLLILSAYGSAFLFAYRKRLDPFYDAVAMVIAAVMVFFTGLLSFVSSPFRILATPPPDGMGLNLLLQDPGMMIHPPILYTGYVGFVVPFAFAMAVLHLNRSGTRWIEEVRRWTLLCRGFLGVGSLRGARWSSLSHSVLFVALTFATFLGTTFPVLSEAVTGTKISVSAPFFNRVNVPIALTLLLLTGAGPVLSWKRVTASVLKRNFLLPAFLGVITVLVALPFGATGVYPLVCIFGAAFVITTIVMEFARGIQARKSAETGALPGQVVSLVQKNKRRYGGYIVHAGMVVIFLGVLGSSVFQKEAHGPLRNGESLKLGPYALTLRGVTDHQRQNASLTTAIVDVQRDGKFVATEHPSKAFYSKSQQPMTEVALHTTPMEDLYLILGGVNEDGSASIQAYINPLVSFVWVGGLIMVFGTLIALSDRMRLRREEKPVP